MIVFSSITRQFGDQILALNDLNFSIDKGEMVLVTGPSGSGKTTLMRLLIREIDPSDGQIKFNDQALDELSISQIPFHRRKIGVVFQDYKLLEELNIWENVALPLYIEGKSQEEIEERVTDVLKLVNMADRAFAFPSQLSGGESQRIGIARALATAPEVLFADEPTGNLDSETTQIIVRLLQKINELGTTVLLATHDKNVLDLLDDIRRIELVKSKMKKKVKKELDEEDKNEADDVKAKDNNQEIEDKEKEEEKAELNEEASNSSKSSKKAKHKLGKKESKVTKKTKKKRFSFKMPEIKIGKNKNNKKVNKKNKAKDDNVIKEDD